MDASQLTRRSQEAVSAAVQSATTSGHAQVEPLHVTAALLAPSDGTPAALVRALGRDPVDMLRSVEKAVGRLPRASGANVAWV